MPAGFIKKWWMEQVGNGANVPGHVVHQDHAVRYRLGRLRESLDFRSQIRQIQGQSHERLPCAVVQLASDSTALLILQLQKPGGEVAQSLVSDIEFRSALAEPLFQVFLGLPQRLQVAAGVFFYVARDVPYARTELGSHA